MNTPENQAPKRHVLRRLAWPLSILLALTALAVGISGYFRLSRDARCLRNSLAQAMESQGVVWHKQFEIHVGAMTCQLLRAGLGLAPLHPEARTALSAVRGFEVGVYQRGAASSLSDASALLLAADQAMADRGWGRLVGVVKEHELVAVYVPNDQGRTSNIQACVAVLDRRQLVIASACTKLEPLMNLAFNQVGRPGWLTRAL